MKRSVKRSIVAWAMWGALVVGCAQTPQGVPLVSGLEQDDIPVRSGFEFVRSETYDPPVVEAGKFRSWRGWYHGKGVIEEIGPWYVDAMGERGWQFTGRTAAAGPVYTYTFVKGEEEATVQVQQIYKSMFGGPAKEVRAEIHPRGNEEFTPEDIARFEAQDRAGRALEENAVPVPSSGTEEGVPTPAVGQAQ